MRTHLPPPIAATHILQTQLHFKNPSNQPNPNLIPKMHISSLLTLTLPILISTLPNFNHESSLTSSSRWKCPEDVGSWKYDPNPCYKYYNCKWGIPRIYDCYRGKVFNPDPAIHRCVDPTQFDVPGCPP